MSRDDDIEVRVKRQNEHEARAAHWDQFVVPARSETVADLLDAINGDPRTVDGVLVSPIAWESSCSFPVCGGCTMLINRRAALACGTRVSDVVGKRRRITLEPLSGFPVIQDLWIDRHRMCDDIRRLRTSPDGDARDEPREAPPLPPTAEPMIAALSRCTECGACIDACPEAGVGRAFVGPAALAAAYRASLLRPDEAARSFEALALEIDDCGRAENCVEVCPEAIPLDEALSGLAQKASRRWLSRLLGRPAKS